MNIRLTTTNHLTLMMISAQIVQMSVTSTNNSPSQDYTHLNDQTTLLHVTPQVETINCKETSVHRLCFSASLCMVCLTK